jgi:hypothetical protein
MGQGWNKVPTSKGLQRNEGTKDPAERFLIVSEGEKTEPNYFDNFGSSWIEVKAIGGQGQWRRVVEAAKELADADGGFDEIWCVFDRDIDGKNPTAKDLFNQALDLAKQYKFKTAYSIDAFELWFLLHFNFHDNATYRKDYSAMLTSRLGKPYKKNDPMLYRDLLDKQKVALKNARKLHLEIHSGTEDYSNDPCTTVYLLVEALIKNQQA